MLFQAEDSIVYFLSLLYIRFFFLFFFIAATVVYLPDGTFQR